MLVDTREISSDVHYKIGKEMRWKNNIYKSMASVVTKSIDYFVQLTDDSVGCIEFFIEEEISYAVVKKYQKVKSYGHLMQVKATNTYQLYPCTEFRHKLIYLKFVYSYVSFMEFITTEPNLIECN